MNDLEGRARSILEAEARKVDKEKVNPSAQFKTFMDRAQRALGEGRFDEAESWSRARARSQRRRRRRRRASAEDRADQSIPLRCSRSWASRPASQNSAVWRAPNTKAKASRSKVIRLIAEGEAVEDARQERARRRD